MRKGTLAVLVTLALVAAAGAALWLKEGGQLPRRFAVVDPGRLYRGGEVSPGQLERLQRVFGIERVISLLDPDTAGSRAEQTAARRLGIEWHNVRLSGDGASTPADREQIRGLLMQPGAPPTLVHCAAGVNRTGLAVGMYRLHCQGWTLAQVMAELRATDFEDQPKHQSLRDALASEAELAAESSTRQKGASQPSEP
jgi:protein tyrosine/serine phosphatase